MSAPASSDPRGSTLWEMFLQWMKTRSASGEASAPALPLENPLDWTPGAPVSLDATHGPEFAAALVRVEELRHVIRKIEAQEFHFTDYVLRASPRDATAFQFRIRCLPDGQGGWQKLLLRLHDEFGFAADFLEVLNDPSGVLTLEDEVPAPDPGKTPESAVPPPVPGPVEIAFQRLNDLQGPWQASILHQREAGEPEQGSMEYWDYLRTRDDGSEEFLFAELSGTSGWIQIWRGSPVFL